MPILRRRIARRWLALAAACVLIALAAAGGVWGMMYFRAPAAPVIRLDISAPPPRLPAPLQEGYMPVDAAKAQIVNSGIAVSTAPVEAARPFLVQLAAGNIMSRYAAVDCLAAAVYYEAANENDRGQRAVAQVVLNRVRHPAFPKSVCGVVYEGSERRTGCQFSFTCDGSLNRKPSQAGWTRARSVALAALAGVVEPSVGTATHYHADYVVPYWAWSLDKITAVGAHIFYRWKGYWGRRAAFNGVYAGEAETDGLDVVLPYGSFDPAAFGGVVAPTVTGPKPLADDIGQLAPGPAPLAAAVPLPSADEQRGVLRADERAGMLIGVGPGPAREARPEAGR